MSTPEAQVATPEIVISPPSRWSSLHLGELWAHRELIYFLTKRELQVRYKQSFFGISWAVLQPLIYGFIFALFFGVVLKVQPPGNLPYAVFAVAGLVPWLFTAQAVTNGSNSLVQDSDLISKVYFPRLALPISKALSLLIDLVIALAVVIVVTLIYGVAIAPTAYLVPAFLMLGVITAFAIGTWLAAVNVKYRDVQVVVPMLVQVLFFVEPGPLQRHPGGGPGRQGVVVHLLDQPDGLGSRRDAVGALRWNRGALSGNRQHPDLGGQRRPDPDRRAGLLPANRAVLR